MKYQKYITVMQMAMGVTASNKDNCLPPKRQLWVPPSSDAAATSSAAPPVVAVSQGKPSLRRIKGRIHRSKSLDSIDLLDCNVRQYATNGTSLLSLCLLRTVEDLSRLFWRIFVVSNIDN